MRRLTSTGAAATLVVWMLFGTATSAAAQATCGPSDVRWVNPASGSFHTGSNWSTGTVPGALDDVCIDVAAAITVTFSTGTTTINRLRSQEAFTISFGTLTITSTSNIDNTFTLSGGTLTGPGELTVNGT